MKICVPHIISNVVFFSFLYFRVHVIFIIAAIAGNIAVLVSEVILKEVDNLISFSGIVIFVLVFYVTSHNPARVS